MSERVDVHIHLHLDELPAGVTGALTELLTHIREIRHMEATTQKKLDDLAKAVAEETTIEQGVETLLTGMAGQIADLKKGTTDPAVLAAIDGATAIVTSNTEKFKAAMASVAPTPAPGASEPPASPLL